MIPMQTPWFLASGTMGKTRSIRRPSRYSGNWGPGMLVTTRLKKRWRDCSRSSWPAARAVEEALAALQARALAGDRRWREVSELGQHRGAHGLLRLLQIAHSLADV